MAAPELTEVEFLQHVSQVGPQLMWFLGAGASRSSGLPTATDITWDLKRKYYCGQQNQDVHSHDVSNKAIRARIQGYMDSHGFPPLGDPSEYSFYFDLTFADDYGAQQRHISAALSQQKISSTIGHRALAALLHMGRARVVFTTNFDEVVETAYASIGHQNLHAFHLEGSYAATEALNNEQFPLYAKVHGDFRYRSIKNLSKDLLGNDEQIQKCLVAAATRFGMIVAGYSGRDKNVMSLFKRAIDQNNAFPHGLFWTTPRLSNVAPNVRELVDYAQRKGTRSGLVQTGTFDEMLSKIWRHTDNKPTELEQRVRSATARPVSITLSAPGTHYPMLRTNALLITKAPGACGAVQYDEKIDWGELRSKMFEARVDCSLTYTDRILFWGASTELAKILDASRMRAVETFQFEDLAKSVFEIGFIKALVEETIARALVEGKPINLRRSGRTWYAVARHEEATNEIYRPLRVALAKNGSLASVNGDVVGLTNVHWSEAVSIRVEERNGSLWLLLRPDVWISPLQQRDNAVEFLRGKRLKRYNTQAFDVLSAWIQILLGDIGHGQTAAVLAYPNADYSARFEISTRTAYSKRNGANG